ARVRALITVCHEASAEGYRDPEDAAEYLDRMEAAIFGATSDRHADGGLTPLGEVVYQRFSDLQRAASEGSKSMGVPTGLDLLDSKTIGLHPGQLIIVAGRPGMGKTAFGLTLARAARHHGPVALFSVEMAKGELADRLMASESRVNLQRVRGMTLAHDEWERLADAAADLYRWPVHIDDVPGLTLMQLRGRCRRLKAREGLSLVIIDYLQLMRSGAKAESREQEIATISRGLKALAKELEVPVVALAQLNRSVESRSVKDRRPQLSDLRESGQIEQDADVVLFLYRDELYNKGDPTNRGIAEVIIGKQRSGPTGTVRARFFSEFVRFEDLAEEEWAGWPPEDESDVRYP
ncbi:MAG: replicative DNA helicase, partial [Myxococcota bacterium]